MTGPRQASTFRFGVFELDLQSGELRKGRIRIRLQDQPLRVLTALLRNPGEVVSREELKQELWPADTFVDFEHGLRVAVNKLRRALNDDPDEPRYVETLPRRGYRFIFPVTASTLTPAPGNGDSTHAQTEPVRKTARFKGIAVLAGSIALFGSATSAWWFLSREKHLTGQHTIVLADFINTAADPVFDGALRQGLSVQLQQSPFLSMVSDDQIRQILQMMGQKADAKLSPELAREVCQRTSASAMLSGSIAQVGTKYLLILKTLNCSNGDLMASTEAEASDKNHVLEALGKAALDTRNKLGESLASIQKFDTPIAQATTSSLEALKAFTLAGKSGGMISDVPFLLHAIELDPNFALAYAQLSDSYVSSGEVEQASLYAQKAFDLSGRVTERERFHIVTTYYYSTLGDLVKELSIYPIWEQMYPRDWGPWVNSAGSRLELGDYEGALRDAREALRLYPGRSTASIYSNLGVALLSLNRRSEAKQIAEQAIANGLDIPDMRVLIYRAAFLDNDPRQMEAQLELLFAKPEDSRFDALCAKSNTEAYFGRLRSALGLSRRGFEIVQKQNYNELAAEVLDKDALLQAELGNFRDAKRDATAGLALSSGRNAKLFAALALARAGDTAHAQALADQLNRRFPSHTLLQHYWLPTLRGSIELARKNPAKAVEALQSVSYELGSTGSFLGNLYPVYLRGQAYLEMHQGKEAASEYQKFLDYRFIVANDPLGALARLGLARAYSLQREVSKARASYVDFLTLWKDADPDIPLLKRAKAEYAKLQVVD